MALATLWEASFPDRSRPTLYSSDQNEEDGFLPLRDVDDFLVDSLPSLTPAQLYALTANNAEALIQAQKEWTDLERLATQIKNRDPLPAAVRDPHELPRREIFEERKEAMLYGYRHEANRRMLPARFTVSENVTEQEKFDCREPPEPFAQGGFIPNDKQYKSLMSVARAEGREKNPDNQRPYTTNFAFHERPKGTWIAKLLPPEAPPPPRTRAREAVLNGSANASDRSTRFNGEKVPPTRAVSPGVSDAPSPAKRTATPVGAGSPAPKKRKIETVDVSNALPRKKHPNQYTKRRELEMAGQLAAAQEHARVHGLPVPEHYTQLEAMSAPTSPVPAKKKHPNQYTKRREREEAERLAREGAPTMQYGQPMPYPPPYGYPYPTYGPPPPPPLPYHHAHSMYAPQESPSKPKHPNQYTKRREREEAERLAALHGANSTAAAFAGHGAGTPSARARFHAHQYRRPGSFDGRSASSRPGTPSQPTGRETSKMTGDEKRRFVFKDHELISELNRDHAWLNDNPETAAAWKAKILQSDYPVRTWAMLRKWREWRAEGKDKRPRDKDGNRIREPVATPANSTPNRDEDVEMADVESAAASQPASEEVTTLSAPAGPATRAMSPLRRPTRLRIRATGLDSPSAMPSSPLVNGISARDLDGLPSSSLSFSSKLQGMGELDTTAKVDTWQEKTQTDYAASTNAGKGALRQHPRLQQRGTEDELYPSSATPEPCQERTGASQSHSQEPVRSRSDEGGFENESEDPLHGSMSETSRSSSPSTDPGERDTAYRSGARTIRRAVGGGGGGGEQMRRTRSSRSAISNSKRAGTDTTAPVRTTRSRTARMNPGSARTPSTSNPRTARSTDRAGEEATSPLTRRNTRTSAVAASATTTDSTITVNPNRLPEVVDFEAGEEEDDDDEGEEQDQGQPRTPSPMIGRRSLRPNPPKRTLTGESEWSGVAQQGVGTRRSARNVQVNVNVGAGGRRGSS